MPRGCVRSSNLVVKSLSHPRLNQSSPPNDRRSAAGGAHDITLQPPVDCSAWLDGVSKFSRGHMTAAGVVGYTSPFHEECFCQVPSVCPKFCSFLRWSRQTSPEPPGAAPLHKGGQVAWAAVCEITLSPHAGRHCTHATIRR
jgi:hypothetical protein